MKLKIVAKCACKILTIPSIPSLKGRKFFTHLDLACGFWQVRVWEEDVHKTACQTRDKLMEWVAMP
jgi:hypothetical protein